MPFVCTSSVKSAIVSLLYLHDDVTTVEKQHADLTEKLNSRCSNNRLSCSSQVKNDKKAEEKVLDSNQLLQVIEEAYPNSLTLDDMSR